jgi:hypothetical protein
MTLEEFVDAVYNVTKTDECWFHFEVRMSSIRLLFMKVVFQPHTHMQGRNPDTTFQCIQYLRRHLQCAGISVEIEKPGRAGLRELASGAHLVFYSKSWAQVYATT